MKIKQLTLALLIAALALVGTASVQTQLNKQTPGKQATEVTGKGAIHEIKEWQAIMDHLRSLPVKNKGELPVIPVDERAAEVRAIMVG